MSLLDEYSDNFTILDKTTGDDGYGGYKVVLKPGATIKGAIAPASQSEVQTAGALGEKTSHTLVCGKEVCLEYHDVLRRASDNLIFRVTNTDGGTYTPASSNLNLKKYRLEAWKVPDDWEVEEDAQSTSTP